MGVYRLDRKRIAYGKRKNPTDKRKGSQATEQVYSYVFPCLGLHLLWRSGECVGCGQVGEVTSSMVLAPAGPIHVPPPDSAAVSPSLLEPYPFKATLWLGIYSHIGNYWYTHYFYTVLKASYSMPSFRLNDVPLPLYFATFFYFSTYHVSSYLLLRRVCTGYASILFRSIFLVRLVAVLNYFTAFTETVTISSFPYYSFEDPFMAMTVGSTFYGIYFLMSFPAFFRLDEWEGAWLSLY